MATYAAVYPHQKNSNGIYNIIVPVVQTEENLKATEVLYATGTAKGEDGAINIIFEHTLAQLKVKLTSAAHLSNIQVNSVRLNGAMLQNTFTAWNANCQCEWGTPTNPGEITLLKNSEAEFESLLVPQTIDHYYITVDAVVDGIEKQYRFESTDLVLEQGATYTLPLQVGKDITTLNSPSAGTIAANPALLDEYLDEAGELSVTGTLNDEDMVAIGDWAIRNANDGTNGNDLLYLDLSGVTGITSTPEGWFYKVLDGSYLHSELLREVILPASVTHIADNTFLACEGLEKITAEGVEIVGYQALANCYSLTAFVGSKIRQIGRAGFMGTAIKSLDVGNLEFADMNAFSSAVIEGFYAPGLKILNNKVFNFTTISGVIDLPACTELASNVFLASITEGFELRLTTKDNITLDNVKASFDSSVTPKITLYLHENKRDNLPEYLDEYTFKAIHFVDDAGNVVETLSEN